MLWTQQQRLAIINQIKATFLKYPEEPINKQKLISQISMEFGSTRRKAAEYIQDLLDANFIKEEIGLLSLKPQQ
jgi:hypothetical protein